MGAMHMGDWSPADRRADIERALQLKREIAAFEIRWPRANGPEEMLPGVSWRQLERQLTDLAASPVQADMARHLVSATRKMSRFKPPEMVLREVLCLTWVLLDENFRPDSDEAASMT